MKIKFNKISHLKFIEAESYDNIEKLKDIISIINDEDFLVERILIAAKNGQIEVIKAIHSSGITLERFGEAAINAAIKYGEYETLKYLHQTGVCFSKIQQDNLQFLGKNGSLETLKYLHTNGLDIYPECQRIAEEAAVFGHIHILKYLTQHASFMLSFTDEILLYVANKNHFSVLKYLQINGVDLSYLKKIILSDVYEGDVSSLANFFQNNPAHLIPKYIIIDNNRSCNARCRMCPTQNKEFDSPKMANSVFEVLINQLDSFKDSIEYVLFGVHGEPLLDKSLESKINSIRLLGITDIRVNTNGSALTETRIKKLIMSGLSSITISVDGFTKEAYESTRIGLNFDSVVSNIRSLIEIRNDLMSKMSISLRLIIQKTNKDEVESWLNYWRNLLNPELDGFHLMPVHNWGYEILGSLGNGKTPCGDIFHSAVISYDGTLTLCCLDHEPIYELGNISRKNILDIYNSKKLNEIRNIHKLGERNTLSLCSNCNLPETRTKGNIESDYIAIESDFHWSNGKLI